MVVLTLGNSYSMVKGLTTSQHRAFKDVLSYTVDAQAAYFSGRFGPRKRSLLAKTGEFPTGLLKDVAEWLYTEKIPFEIEDTRVVPKKGVKVNFEGPEARPSQLAAVKKALEHGRGIISAPTGSGKSHIIKMAIAAFNMKTLVVVPNLGIKEQMKETLKDLKNVDVENIDSKSLQKPKGYDLLILDEAHHGASATYQRLNKTAWSGIYHRLFYTATPFRNVSDEMLLFKALTGEIIHQLSYKDAIAEGAIVPIESYYYSVPKTQVEGHTYAQVYNEIVVCNEVRNEMISTILLRLNASSCSTLCLVKEIVHGGILADMTGLPFISGQNGADRDLIQQFSSGEIKALIATEGIMAEGIDSRAAEYVIVAGLGKAKSSLMQKVGRVLRRFDGKTSGKVILFRDPSHKWSVSHFTQQKKIILDEYSVQTFKLEL